MAKREMKTVKTEVSEVVEPVVEETAVVPETEVLGTVVKCTKLNVRKKPNVNADIVCVVNAKAKLTIDEDKSKGTWYAVTTEDGKIGYCMKGYVAINK